MAAGTEGKAGVELEVDGVAVGRFVPRGGNPQAFGNLDGVELRLGQAHPVLVGEDFAGVCQVFQPACLAGGLNHGCGIVVFTEQDDDFALLPDLFGRHTGFAEDGLFVFGACVGVFDGGGECAVFHQGIGETFGDGVVDVDGDLLIGHGGLSRWGRLKLGNGGQIRDVGRLRYVSAIGVTV